MACPPIPPVSAAPAARPVKRFTGRRLFSNPAIFEAIGRPAEVAMPPKSPPAAVAPRPTPVSGAVPGAGHSAEFLANPALFMLRAWRESGERAEVDLGGRRNILMVGP